jgi:hypothetical protein
MGEAEAEWAAVWAAQARLRVMPLPERWRSCLAAWESLPGGEWAARMVRDGLSWPWHTPVPLSTSFRRPPPPTDPVEAAALEELVEQAVRDGAMVELPAVVAGDRVNVTVPMWCSPAFVVPKAVSPGEARKFRLVVSMRKLNQLRRVGRFACRRSRRRWRRRWRARRCTRRSI